MRKEALKQLLLKIDILQLFLKLDFVKSSQKLFSNLLMLIIKQVDLHWFNQCTCADCPEEVTVGVVWERTVTKTSYKHQCSNIHPSFKLTDMATRECMKNRTWAPVNMSQCVMDIDSPVVMILTVTLDTENTTLVQAEMGQIMDEVCVSLQMSFYIYCISKKKNTSYLLKYVIIALC